MPPLQGNDPMKIDRTSIEIIKHLKNGRKSFGQIAKDLDVAENTVRSRVSRLIKEGVLDISGVINPEALPRHQAVMIGVKLATMNLIKKGEEFSKLKGVVSVSVVTGRFDLILIVLLKEGFGLLEFYTEEVANLEGIQSVETFVVYKSYNLTMPYIL
jgi:Lrp/AsnC family transcriptional regulator for asnA, asnC and gidA